MPILREQIVVVAHTFLGNSAFPFVLVNTLRMPEVRERYPAPSFGTSRVVHYFVYRAAFRARNAK